MEIEYLNKMEETTEVFGFTNKGESEEVIDAFQVESNMTFPKAYREFLFLAGRYCNLRIAGSTLKYSIKRQVYTKRTLKELGLSIEGGEFWVISELDGGEQFDFFYFDDPDALDSENPPVYVSHPAYLDDGLPLKEKIADTFSQYIDDKIRAYTKQ